MTDAELTRTWHIRIKPDTEFAFFATTRRDHTVDQMYNLLPKKGSGYLVPVIGGAPHECWDRIEHHNGRTFIYVAQSDIIEMWYKDDLPPAQHLKLFDMINASTTEST